MSAKDLKFTLNNGNAIPLVGFGTNGLNGKSIMMEVLDCALAAGYRLFDTATMYGNEAELGSSLKELLPKHGLTRSDIFISTKLYPEDQGEKAANALKKSLEKLDCEYIDLYTINWPGCYGVSPSSKQNAILRDMSWQQMVVAVKEGLVKNIGVSSYTERHLKKLISNNHGVMPCINQVEWHPYCHPKKLQDICKKHGILIQAYHSLGGSNNNELLEHPSIVKIANQLEKSTAQVLLRWSLQQDIAVLPKSGNKSRIISNMELDFTIPEADMKVMNSFKKHIRYDWDPETIA